MARSTQEIFDAIILRIQNEPSLSALTSVSQVAFYRNFAWTVASSIQYFEQLMDFLLVEVQEASRTAISGTSEWLQNRMLNFQFDSDPLNPQIPTEIDGVITYPVVDPALRIITRCAVIEQANRTVKIKVAKGDSVVTPLSNDELLSAKAYGDVIGFVGIPLDVISQESDRCAVSVEVYYGGQFVESNVKADVIQAITDYLASVSIVQFDGTIVISALIDSIQAVAGVTDLDTAGLVAILRDFSDPLGSESNIAIDRTQETFSGHVVPEDEAGFTLNDTVTMILAQ